MLLLLAVVMLGACRSHKKTVTGGSSAVISSCYSIGSITVPKCDLNITDGGKSYQMTGSIYITPDSVCYFRGVYMNLMEMTRGVIYRDSFAVINRPERICFKGKNDFLSRFVGYPVTPETLLLLFTADRCEDIYRNGPGFRMIEKDDDKIVMQTRTGNLPEMKINSDNQVESVALTTRLYGNRTEFSVSYGNYRRYGNLMLPGVFDIAATDGKTSVKINIDFRDILFDQPQNINFSIPSGYKVVMLQ